MDFKKGDKVKVKDNCPMDRELQGEHGVFERYTNHGYAVYKNNEGFNTYIHPESLESIPDKEQKDG